MNPYAKPVKHRPYRLNMWVKEKVKKEVDKVIVVGLIFLVDEVEWISPILIQDKKVSKEIQVCVDYCSLNNMCTWPISHSL